jgi:D-Tyr-tRNA(Tyr) deacylase
MEDAVGRSPTDHPFDRQRSESRLVIEPGYTNLDFTSRIERRYDCGGSGLPPNLPVPLVGDTEAMLVDQEAERDVATGVFGARMELELVTDGPVTVALGT